MRYRDFLEETVRRAVRTAAPKSLYARGAHLYDAYLCAQQLGWPQYRRIMAASRPQTTRAEPLMSLALPDLSAPFMIRPGTTDARTVLQTIGRQVFARFVPPEPVRFIIDAGANIGDTAVWFLARFPRAVIVAIEPDPDNARILRLNTAAYGERVRVMEGAVWTTDEPLQLVRSSREDGSLAISGPDQDATSCRSITMDEILDHVGGGQVDIFKCDIEGAEEQLFSGACPWLTRTRMAYVEAHNSRAEANVRAAASRHGFRVQRYRELLVLTRP